MNKKTSNSRKGHKTNPDVFQIVPPENFPEVQPETKMLPIFFFFFTCGTVFYFFFVLTHSPHSSSIGRERERIRRVNREVCRGRGHRGTKNHMTKTMTMNLPIMIRRLSFVSTMSFPKKIVRLLHSAKQKELFLIGVPFSGGQVKYQTNSIGTLFVV